MQRNVGKPVGLWYPPEMADAVVDVGTYASLVLENDTNACVAFNCTSTNHLRVAANASPSHARGSTSVETSGNADRYTSLGRSDRKNLYLGQNDQTFNDVPLVLNVDIWGWQLPRAVDTVGDQFDAAVGPPPALPTSPAATP